MPFAISFFLPFIVDVVKLVKAILTVFEKYLTLVLRLNAYKKKQEAL